MGREQEQDQQEQARRRFEYARRIRDDPNYLILSDINSLDEERWLAIGNVGHMAVVVVVHTYRGDEDDSIVRISARKATRHERARYAEESLR